VSAATSVALSGLAGRLTDSQDRERYTAILLYLQALPPEDEFRHLAEIMGLLTLLGQRVPDALADAMTELRELTTTVSDYHDKVDARLATLPAQITDGVDLAAIGEAFRQQLANTSLENSAALLRTSSKEITALSDEISKTLKPISREYKTISGTLAGEITKLTTASAELRNQNARLMLEQHSASWWWLVTAALVIFLLGGISGMFLDKQETADALNSMTLQLERLQTPIAPPAALNLPRKPKKRGATNE
jgi:uncharacterized phage infection (PIP) family protein YhgE